MTDLAPYNRLVRKRNCSLQHQLNVTLHLLTEEYRQTKERMYKDERECGRFLQSLYSTVPGLQTYGQPDTRAMNADASLKERRFSIPAPDSHAGNNNDDDDNGDDKKDDGDDLSSSSGKARRTPSASVQLPASQDLRPTSAWRSAGGDLQSSRDKAKVLGLPAEENDRVGRKTSFARQLPRPGTAAGTGNRTPRGHVPAGGKRPVTATSATGRVVDAAAAAVAGSSSPWSLTSRFASHHGFHAHGWRKARAAALYGMAACSERERRLHQQVIGQFKVIFDPLRKAGDTLDWRPSRTATAVHVALGVSPASHQPGNIIPQDTHQSANSGGVSVASLTVCNKSSNNNTAKSNNDTKSIYDVNIDVDHHYFNGSSNNADKQSDEGRRRASGRRVVWSAHPSRRKAGVVAAPDLATLERPSSDKPLRSGLSTSNPTATEPSLTTSALTQHAGSGAPWKAAGSRKVMSCSPWSHASGSSGHPVSGGGVIDPKVQALALVRHPLLAHGWTAGAGDDEELSDVSVVDDDGDSEVDLDSEEPTEKVDSWVNVVKQETSGLRTDTPASCPELKNAIQFSKSATHEQHVASLVASSTSAATNGAVETFSELTKDETTDKPHIGGCSKTTVYGESASVKPCVTSQSGTCSHQQGLDKKQLSSAAKKTRTSSSGFSLHHCNGTANWEAGGSVRMAAQGSRHKRPASPCRHAEEDEAGGVQQQDPSKASKPPPTQLMARLMASGVTPGAPASAAREPSSRRPAPSTAQLSQRSVPAPRQTVAGILAQMENQKASTRAMLDTSLRLQKVVKKLVPLEELLPNEEDDSEDQ